jgi:membrane-bound ClpP family serine protease
MFWLIIAVLIVIGLLFLVLEILVIPGTGIAGVIGFALLGIGIWQTYATYGNTPGHLVLAGTFVLTLVTLLISLRAKTWRRVSLNTSIASKVNTGLEERVKVGDEGEAVSRLVPAGKAFINGDYYEVRTKGEFLDQGTKIVVTKVDHNQIKVKQKDPEA